MKVLTIKTDTNGACGFYRAEEPARVVREQFPDIDIRVQTSIEVEASQDTRSHLITVHEIKEDIDLLVVQRPLKQSLWAALEQARKQGIATVVELDDDFSTISRQNLAYSDVQPENKPLVNKEWLRKAAESADLLTCTTEALRKYNESYAVLPNYIPRSVLDFERPLRDKPVAGWTGTLQTHPHDLDVTRGQVGNVLASTDTDFFVVGDPRGVREALKLKDTTGIGGTGWIPLEMYHQLISENIDIGIVPLERSDFNNAKSWLKGLEFAALGIPFVATATADYQRLADLGVGKLADDHNGFRYALRNWINNPEKAKADGEMYRDIVRESLTYEKHAKDWVNAWERAIDIRKKASN